VLKEAEPIMIKSWIIELHHGDPKEKLRDYMIGKSYKCRSIDINQIYAWNF
jgi:hypothetical protein